MEKSRDAAQNGTAHSMRIPCDVNFSIACNGTLVPVPTTFSIYDTSSRNAASRESSVSRRDAFKTNNTGADASPRSSQNGNGNSGQASPAQTSTRLDNGPARQRVELQDAQEDDDDADRLATNNNEVNDGNSNHDMEEVNDGNSNHDMEEVNGQGENHVNEDDNTIKMETKESTRMSK